MPSVLERLGLWSPPYTVTDGPGPDTITVSKSAYSVQIPRADRAKWRSGSGQSIQDAMPYLTPDQREFLISGTTPDGWRAMLGQEDAE